MFLCVYWLSLANCWECPYLIVMIEWCLIFAITLVSTTLLMIFGEYLAILPQAQHYFNANRTMVLLLSNSFNIFYIIISPLIFHIFNRQYFWFVMVSTSLIGLASIGRYFAADDYLWALLMAIIIAIGHIPIISAPYGLLKLFPERQRGYAVSIPLFLPVLGMNFSILYDMLLISRQEGNGMTPEQVSTQINTLNAIIAGVGTISSILTVILLFVLRKKIEMMGEPHGEELSFVQSVTSYWSNHKRTFVTLVCWGSIVGVSWTYGSLFAVIFEGQGLTERQIALLGLVANISTALFSNLGTFIKNKYGASNTAIIFLLNLIGFLAVILLQASRHIVPLANLYLMIGLIVVLRAGFSSFVSLAFLQLERSGIPSVVVSGLFFWVANLVNLIGMELVDLVTIDLSNVALAIIIALCINIVSETYLKKRAKC